MVNNGTFEEEYRKVHGEEAQIVVTLERNLDFRDAKTYRTENPETTPYTDAEGNEIDVNEDGTIEPIMVELTTGLGFKPIGTIVGIKKNEIKYNSFKGTFDGKENTISNLHIDTEEEVDKILERFEQELGISREELEKQIEETGGLKLYFTNLEIELCNRINAVGLFGVVGAEENEVSEIKNLNVKDTNLNGYMFSQGVVAMANGNGDFKFSNCNIEKLNVVNLCSDGYTTGMLGTYIGKGNCQFSGCNIKNSVLNGGKVVSGILGQNMGGTNVTISNCKIDRSNLTTMEWYTGGILGYPIIVDNLLVENCEVNNSIIESNEGTAGIVVSLQSIDGNESNGKIDNCKVLNSNLKTTGQTGFTVGIVGISVLENLEIINCNVINSSIECKNETYFCSGIAGQCYINDKLKIDNCFVLGGKIDASDENTNKEYDGIASGIASEILANNIYINNCYTKNIEIIGKTMTVGICAMIEDGQGKILNCYNENTILKGDVVKEILGNGDYENIEIINQNM